MADINDLKDICISSGTLRAEDLLPKFMGILKDYAPEKFNEFIKGYPELDGWEDFLEADWRIISDDTKMNASDDLFGLLNDIAPEGTMFSSTEGDGADFGFWTVEEKLLDDDEGEKALKQMAKNGKSTGEVAADIRYDVATALDMVADKAEDLMTKFSLDNIYVLRAQGLSPKAIAKKILKACESKDEDLNTAKDFVYSIAPVAILVRQAGQPGFKDVKNSDDHIIVGFMRHDNTRFIIDWDADKKQGTATRQVPVDDKDALYGYKWVTPKSNANVTFTTREELKDFVEGTWDNTSSESKKSESLTLKQKELKDMARYGEAEDITMISNAEAKELKKKGIETVGVSRGTYGMNGALLRDREGNKYVITARSSNLFYFV